MTPTKPSAHTPKPWADAEGTIVADNETGHILFIPVDCEINGVSISEDEQKANAELIVRSVNEYEALLNLLATHHITQKLQHGGDYIGSTLERDTEIALANAGAE